MSQDLQDNTAEKDIATNWVSSSRFFFYVSIFAILALVLGNCSQLYKAVSLNPIQKCNLAHSTSLSISKKKNLFKSAVSLFLQS